jgi:deoxyribodipyrimidine photo-lyase
MTAARRTRFNFGLEHAIALALEFRKPLVVLEALRVDYPDASDRLHRFVVEGMAANARAFKESRVLYYPYVEPATGAGAGLIEALSASACAVVTDWYPSYFLPAMLAAVAPRIDVAVQAVDSNGLIPVSEHGRSFPTARGYRAFVQRTLRDHLQHFPSESPLGALGRSPRLARLPASIERRWPATPVQRLRKPQELIASLPVDHAIQPVAMKGGQDVATRTLRIFLDKKLQVYSDQHNDPDADCTSRLSPYLHFGHISAHEIFSALMTHERWTTRKLRKVRAGAREGWWGVSGSAENFLDQIVVWRELAFNGCAWAPGYETYDTLPAWARATLESHLDDPRPHLYSLHQLENAETHDEVWNAAQRQLRSEGWFHGYMRMLWGKKILEWCRDPAEALDRMEVLMNRYSLDGRDPVSYLNYGWVLGRHDRPWPERPIFGTVRSMTSASAKRKLRMKNYLARFAL